MPKRKRGRSSTAEVQLSTDESDLEIDIEEVSDSNDAESSPSPKNRKLSPARKKRRQNETPRARKVLDNHDQPSGRRSRRLSRLSSSASSSKKSEQFAACSVCYGTDESDDSESSEELLLCTECGVANHPSCLNMSEMQSRKVRSYPWQCEGCKSCFVCDTASHQDKLLLCNGCDKGFHMFCLMPKIKHLPKGQWLCEDCRLESSDLTSTTLSVDANLETPKSSHLTQESTLSKESDSTTNSGIIKKRGRGRPRKEETLIDSSTPPPTNTDSEQSADTGVNSTPRSVLSKRRMARTTFLKKTKIDVKQKKCPTPGCDGSGHVTGRFAMHHVQSGCPKFHNFTAEECRMKARKRAQSQEKRTPLLGSPKSPPESPRKSLRNKVQLNFMPEKVRAAVLNKEIIPDFQSVNRQKSKYTASRTEREKASARSSLTGELPLSQVEQLNEVALRGITSEYDFNLFKEAWIKAKQANDEEMYEPLTGSNRCIVLGKYEIGTWYTSPYPEEYLRLKTIYICEFCLKYAKSSTILRRHMVKCSWRHPPGNEIYRKNGISVWEVDGKKSKGYCQNLCLMAKLFLDHKTLYYDVEPFLFYVMTKADSSGCHLLGYFSKEKKSFLNYNVSCILTLPQYMRQGYGKMLIDFSYLLSKAEGKTGSPEKPLSDLGLISYRSYWKGVILKYLINYGMDRISIKDISLETALHPSDIVSTLQYLGILKYWKGKHVILRSQDLFDDFVKKISLRPPDYQEIDPINLKWTPPSIDPQAKA